MMLVAILSSVLAALPIYKEDRGAPEKPAQLAGIAAAIAEHSRTAEEAAFLAAWAYSETKFSLRIHSGRCRPQECDRGRARGPYQPHRNGMPFEQWERMHGVENTWVQTEHAARQVRWALRQCPGDRIRGAFRVLGGLACHRKLRGEDERVAVFERVRAKL